MSKRRLDKEGLEWMKLLIEVTYTLILTIYYILREFVSLFAPPPAKSIAGQHVLVTGAARGLGRELCIALGKEGCIVTCVDVQEEGCQETAAMVNAITRSKSSTAHYCDVTDRQQVFDLIASLPPVDILVNNAGIVSSASITEVSDKQIETMMQVNVMSHFWTIRAVIPGMIARGHGHVVGIASVAAFTAAANIVPYTATKYAVTGMMASLREEMRKKAPGVQVSSVHPFFISPPASSVQHWDKTSRLQDVTASDVAFKTVEGIKRNRSTITIPRHLFFWLHLNGSLPVEAGDLWRDLFYANISSLDNKKPMVPKTVRG